MFYINKKYDYKGDLCSKRIMRPMHGAARDFIEEIEKYAKRDIGENIEIDFFSEFNNDIFNACMEEEKC